MKTYKYIAALLLTICLVSGCASQDITKDPNTGASITNYVPNTSVASAVNTAQTVTPVITQFVPAPYQQITTTAVGILGLLATGIAGAIATYQNKKKNEHLSTLKAVVSGIEGAIPSVQEALSATSTTVPGASASLKTASDVLSVVKESIHSTTVASGTNDNLNNVLSSVGIGPKAA